MLESIYEDNSPMHMIVKRTLGEKNYYLARNYRLIMLDEIEAAPDNDRAPNG